MHLLSIMDNAAARHAAWVNNEGPFDAFARVIDELCGLPAEEGSAAALTAAIARMAGPWTDFKHSDDEIPLPSPAFWAAFDALVDLREEFRPQPNTQPEPLRQLIDQRVPPHQICDIWGFVDQHGRPDMALFNRAAAVADEPAKLAEILGPDYLPPMYRRRQQQQQVEQLARDRLREARQSRIRSIVRPAPESIEDLARAGVSARQIAAIHRCRVGDVLRACQSAGLPAPPLQYDHPGVGRQPFEPGVPDEIERAMAAEDANPIRGRTHEFRRPEAGSQTWAADDADGDVAVLTDPANPANPADLASQVRQLAADGLTPREIAESLSSPDRAVSTKQVRGILRGQHSE